MSIVRRPRMIAIGILAAGVVGAVILVALRPEPEKVDRQRVDPLVSIALAEAGSGSLAVSGNGSVRPVRQVVLVAEVPGKLVEASPSLVSGGVFEAGDVLARIEATDYANAVAVAEAEVTRGELDLLVAKEESAVARDEWERLARRTGETVDPESTELGSLVLKEPQVRLAEAQLRAAQARLSDAQLRLDRTVLRAPFTGRVRSESAEVGQVVASGQSIATVYATDELEIAVPLASEDAALVPAPSGREGGSSPAKVSAVFAGVTYRWEGYVHRVEGTVDAATRTMSVVVRIRPDDQDSEAQALFVGMFTTVELPTREFESFVRIPVAALREGDTIWVVENGALRIRSVTTLQQTTTEVVLAAGVAAGEPVVVSDLGVVTDGMSVRTPDPGVGGLK